MGEYLGRSDRNDPSRTQDLVEHINNVSKLMGDFCEKYTIREIGEVCGKLHDLGKYSDDFQKRIRGENIKVDHSTAGAKKADEIGKQHGGFSGLAYSFIEYAVAGHHAGLPNIGNENADGSCLYQRLNNCDLENYSAWKKEIKDNFPKLDGITSKQNFIPDQGMDDVDKKNQIGFSFFLYVHFLFSSLIDADRTDAMRFDGIKTETSFAPLSELKEKFDKYMDSFSAFANDSELNKTRSEILQKCRNAAAGKRGIYALNVPTGGGKTLSSMAFALEHAYKNGHDRIIYTIPFTTIIEQNAGVYKGIFGQENVLEHHSNFVLPKNAPKARNNSTDIPEDENYNLMLAVSNWDAPIILTTNVQFFESLFTANASRSRKVHNIANSVIILDEVQALPNQFIKPCMYALRELVKNYNCTVLLCTATQPEFEKNNVIPSNIHVTEVITDSKALAEKMKRAKCQYIGKKTVPEISSLLLENYQALCIVNTKRHARDIYQSIKDSKNCYHLSTNMYPAHRKRVIEEIRGKLKAGEECRVVSTQLIEAGVDIDFPTVFRSTAGVDSIAQATGRCNREGKLDMGYVSVFDPEEEYKGQDYIRQTADITLSLRCQDFLSLEAISRYFSELYSIRRKKLDEKSIIDKCREAFTLSAEYAKTVIPFACPFSDISDAFKLISDSGCAVVVPVEKEAIELINKAQYTSLNGLFSRISQYSVNVRKNDLDKLYETGAVTLVANDSLVVLTNPAQNYDQNVGIILPDVENKEMPFLLY